MPIPKTCLAFFAFVATALHAGSSEVANIPEIGAHQPVLIVEKNVNPENKMVVYTKLDANGHFMADGNWPLLDFYWMMDGKNYKPVQKGDPQAIHRAVELGVGEQRSRKPVKQEADSRNSQAPVICWRQLDCQLAWLRLGRAGLFG